MIVFSSRPATAPRNRRRGERRAVPRLAALLGVALLAVPLAGCGGDPGPVTGTVITDLSAGRQTTLAFDTGFGDSLVALGVAASPAGRATLADGTLTFPVTGGWVDVFDPAKVQPYVIGQIQHQRSGLTLTRDGVTLTLGNFDVDPGRSVIYADVVVNGTVLSYAEPLLDLDGSTLQQPAMRGSDVVLAGLGVRLTNTAADLIDTTFDATLAAHDLVGTATVTLATG